MFIMWKCLFHSLPGLSLFSFFFFWIYFTNFFFLSSSGVVASFFAGFSVFESKSYAFLTRAHFFIPKNETQKRRTKIIYEKFLVNKMEKVKHTQNFFPFSTAFSCLFVEVVRLRWRIESWLNIKSTNVCVCHAVSYGATSTWLAFCLVLLEFRLKSD